MLEYFAIGFTVLCIFLAGRNNVWTWPVGLVACVLYGVLFFQVKLFADAILQIFFVITGLIGWYSWYERRGKEPLPIKKLSSPGTLIGMIAGTVFIALGYGVMLKEFTSAYAPGWDSAVLFFSVLGQFLLMRRYVETWVIWAVVNTIAVPLFWSRELYMSSILYAVFWGHSWYALYVWNKKYRKTV